MTKKIEPLDALEPLIYLVGYDSLRRKPGAIVSRQRPEVREALSRLTSDELSKMRVPEYVCRAGGRRGRASIP